MATEWGPHPLSKALVGAARGFFPAADGGVDVFPPDEDGTCAVVSLTGHAYVLADVDPAEVAQRAPNGGFGGVMDLSFLQWLAGDTYTIGSIDVLLAHEATGTKHKEASSKANDEYESHPGVRAARAKRSNVTTIADAHGVAVLGAGLVGRRELSIELLQPQVAPKGAGREIAALGLAAAAPGELIWAQVNPGNARSLRTALAAGFTPIGSEVLLRPRKAQPPKPLVY